MGTLDDRANEFLEFISRIDNSITDTPDTAIRKELRRQVAQYHTKQHKLTTAEELEEERLLRLEFLHLREQEVNGNLCWMNSTSWRQYQNQELFKEIVNPVIWNGVFFAVEDLLDNYEFLFPEKHPDSTFLFGKYFQYYRIFGFTINTNDPVDYLDIRKFNNELMFFSSFQILRRTSYFSGTRYDSIKDDYYYTIMELNNLYGGLV